MVTSYSVEPVVSTSTRRELALIALCDVCNRPSPQAEIDAAQAELEAAREADEAFKAAKKAVSK